MGIEGDQVVGLVFDGPYFNTHVDDLYREHLGLDKVQCPLTWDWMHDAQAWVNR